MKTKIYKVKGSLMDIDKVKPFTKELKAIKEEDIEEKILSDFGSKHRLSRKDIKIESIEEISKEDVTDPIIKELI
ncbi:MAG: 50S ribosomal protein L18Ae [Methanobacteriaceae archaeon]|nr:50S ribosomal protein L18Ae [Methanobacteriaceae archaeon]